MGYVGKEQKLIISIALLATNFFYLLISFVLVTVVNQETVFDYPIASGALLLGVLVCLIPSILFVRHALINDTAIEKIIIRLAIYHIPSLVGLMYFVLVTFQAI